MVLSITAINNHFENNILDNPNWIKNSVINRQKKGTYKRPHKRNRKLAFIQDEKFKELVEFYGVLAVAKKLDVSQSTVRERALKMGIVLKSGPRPALTQTTEYRKMLRTQRLNQNIPTHATSIEKAIWAELSSRNIVFEKQKSIINLTQPDAFIEPNICIYADGDYWHNRPENKNHDQYVNRGLKKAGYKIFRFWEHEINTDVKACIDRVIL